jgi:hypothetical protein
LKTLIRVLFLFSFAVSAQALEFSAGVQHAGWLGEKVIFGGIENETHSFGLDLLLGRSADSDGQSVDQISFKFRYSPWWLDLPYLVQWQPVYFGFFGTYTDGHEFFYESNGKYPEKNYYDPTMHRYGFLLGTSFQYKKFGVYTEVAALDKSMESQVVANGSLSWTDLLSASVGLRWNF